MKMPNFTFYGGRKQATTKFSFCFQTWVRSPRNQLQENLPTLDINHQFYLKTEVVAPSWTPLFGLPLIFNTLYSFLFGLPLCEIWQFLYLSPDLQHYEHVELDFSLSCPGSTDDPCAHWDHTVQLYVCCNSASKLCGQELGRWITPFRSWISSASHPIDI